MSEKVDFIKRLQLLEKALKENRVNSSVCVELEPEISGYELDFTEHDKVFEDKIARLEEQIAEMRKLCVKNDIYEIEKAQLCLLRDENKKLKQRIAELESKETEKQKKCTAVIVAKEISGQTYVTLGDFMSVVNDLQAEKGT